MSDGSEKTEKKRAKRVTKVKTTSITNDTISSDANASASATTNDINKVNDATSTNATNNVTNNVIFSVKENSDDIEHVELYEEGEPNVKIPKKRGRKPKGGKIIKPPTNLNDLKPERPNIILHLKCSLTDVEENVFSTTELTYDPTALERVNGFSFSDKKLPYEFIKSYEPNSFQSNDRAYPSLLAGDSSISKLQFDNVGGYSNTMNTSTFNANFNSSTNFNSNTNEYEGDNVKDIWKKLAELENSLHNNDISDKKSACFWCTCDFDNPPIFIPRYELNNVYHVYGCFCSPECATAFLMKENIDTASKFERYHLLNHIYCKIYNYERNIKPAPNPFYTLNKYYGNLTIQEYRKLLKNERLLLIVDKPLTRQLPELHQDNDDFIINNNSIPSASKYKLRRGNGKQTKNSIVSENFGTK